MGGNLQRFTQTRVDLGVLTIAGPLGVDLSAQDALELLVSN